MPRKSRLTQKEILEIRALIAKGLKDREIAEKVGRSRSTVTKIRHEKATRDVTTGGAKVHARLTNEEYEAFKRLCTAAGISVSDGLRRLVRHNLGVLDLKKDEIDELHKTRVSITKVGVNINRLVLLAERGKLKINERDRALLGRLDEKIDEALRLMIRVVTAARRRSHVAVERVLGEADDA